MSLRSRLQESIRESDVVLNDLRKRPWLDTIPRNVEALKVRSKNKKDAKGSAFRVRLLNLYRTFERLLPNDPTENKKILILGGYTLSYGLLEKGNSVTCISTGTLGTAELIPIMKQEYPKTFRFFPKRLSEEWRNDEKFDLVVVDVNTPHRTELVANTTSPLFRSIIENSVDSKLVIIGRVPLELSLKSLVSSMWICFAQLGIVSHTLRTRNPDEFNWAVCFKVSTTKDLIVDLEKLWSLVLMRKLPSKDCLTGDREGDVNEVFNRVIDVLNTESARLKEIAEGIPMNEEKEWGPLITNKFRAREHPYTPSIHSSISRQHGMIRNRKITENIYEIGAQENRPACHWGQLKLLVSEMEFLSMCRDKKISKGATVVYIGSAPGQHTNLLINMFKEISKWILLDPSKTLVNDPKVERIQKFVTDDMIISLKERLDAHSVIYMNDMRTDTREESVSIEMINQAKWGIHLRAKAMLLKFRMPYLQQDGTYLPLVTSKDDLAISRQDLSNVIAYKTKYTSECLESGERTDRVSSVLYLDGEIQPQVFAPSTSTESRLIVFPTSSGKYKLGKWDIRSYEWCMNDYNNGLRMRQDGYNIIDNLPVPNQKGIDDGYESVRMISAFRRVYGKKYQSHLGKSLKFLEQKTEKIFEECSLLTMSKRARKEEYNTNNYWNKIWENRINDYLLFLHGKQ